jgi:hypothetical protein
MKAAIFNTKNFKCKDQIKEKEDTQMLIKIIEEIIILDNNNLNVKTNLHKAQELMGGKNKI